jgi:diguanylate cyclase (GGDEF)-like protein
VAAINTGQVHRYLTKPWTADELLAILREAARTFALERSHEQLLEELPQLNQELENRVQQRTSELEEVNRQLLQKNMMLEKLALTDPLTGMPNRRAMDRLVRTEVSRRVRYPGPLAVALIDVDHFKDINSRYLLPGGDQVLIGLGQTLMNSIRTVDTVGRVGGEEFQLLAPMTDHEGAARLVERLRDAVEQAQFPYENEIIRCTVSIGCAVADASALVGYEQLRLVAAAALQEAKKTGRNRTVICRITENISPLGDGSHRRRDSQESVEHLPVETEELES